MMKTGRKVFAVWGAMSLLSLAAAQPGQTNVEGLNLLANRFRIEALAEKEEALRMAPLYGLATKGFAPNGSFYELMAIREGRPLYYIVENVKAAITIGANRLHPGGSSGLNLTGAGVLMGIWDGGIVRPSHQEFSGRVVVGDGEPVVGNHATHVGGTMIGVGVDPMARGMSLGGTLQTRGWNSDLSEMAGMASVGMRLSNHSYGYISGWEFTNGQWYWYGNINIPVEFGFGRYDQSAQSFDSIAYNAPLYLIVKSAGDDRLEGPATQPVQHWAWTGSQWVMSSLVRSLDGGPNGYDSIPYTATAKNILTVGAVDDVLNYAGAASVPMSTFSGWGPTDDGRIKPDIVANGVGVTSAFAFDGANASNTAYGTASGTSSAAPSVTGTLGLVLQRWRQLFPSQDPRSATMKALAIHTAREAGPANGPDFSFGYGLLNAVGMANLVAADSTKPDTIIEEGLTQYAVHTYTVYANGDTPLKATLCWTDPAAPVQPLAEVSTSRLTNDLDLRIVGSSTHYPWILDPANPANPATTGDNARDNVEKVEVKKPAPGWYTVTVSHKGDLMPAGSQGYSLILTGFTKRIKLKNVTLNPTSLIGSFNAVGWVVIDRAAPPGGYNIPLKSSDASVIVPTSVTIPAGANSAKFTVSTKSVSVQTWAHVAAWKLPEVWSKVLEVLPGGLWDFAVGPPLVVGGTTVNGYVTLSAPAPAGGTVVATGDDTTKISTPASVTVLEGATQRMFQIGTSPVASSVTRTVYAKMGSNRISRSLTLLPALPGKVPAP